MCIPGQVAANTRPSPSVVLVLAQRLRRWPNAKTALGERLVLAGLLLSPIPFQHVTCVII